MYEYRVCDKKDTRHSTSEHETSLEADPVCRGEDLAEDDSGVCVVPKVHGRNDQLHQVTAVLIVADV